MKNILIVVQARMGSSRFPGKILLDIEGQPLLIRLLERVKRIKTNVNVVVATTDDPSDDQIVEVCGQYSHEYFRGDTDDLLDRHYQVARKYRADVVVKIPSDCPLIDPVVIDSVLENHLAGDWDFTSNLHPASYPDGNDVEVMEFNALKTAWKYAQRPMEREHTTPYIWENPEKFRINNVIFEEASVPSGQSPPNFSMTHRWTIDYPEDYEFIKAVYAGLYHHKPDFGLYDILRYLNENPKLMEINKKYAGVNWYRHHLSELKTIGAAETRSL